MRHEIAVLCRMPLGGDFRIDGSQIVVSGKQFTVRTIRTTGAVTTAGNSGIPFMPLFTLPPNLFVTVGRNIVRREIAIFGRMPLDSEHRVLFR